MLMKEFVVILKIIFLSIWDCQWRIASNCRISMLKYITFTNYTN